MPSETLYYFAVGGTGALTVEPLLLLCAAGIGPARLAITLIDADAANPAFGRAQQLIQNYEKVRKAFGNPAEGFFRTELVRTKRSEAVWSPLGGGDVGAQSGSMSLEDFVEKPRMAGEDQDAATLLDLLFSAEQQKEQLREGFRGNPAIGSVLMHGLRESRYFKELMSGAKQDSEAPFFAVGSIFGGTGASALPVLAQILHAEGITAPRIGGALITPYYSLNQPAQGEAQDGRLKPNSDVFLLNTAAALPTYTRGHSKYGTLYVLGDKESLSTPRKVYSAGGTTQRNDPHAIELFAALAALDFARREERDEDARVYYATAGDKEMTWDDLPLSSHEDRHALLTFLVASNFFLQYFRGARSPARQQELQRELTTQAWLTQIRLNPAFVRDRAPQLELLESYFTSVWGYLHAVTHNYVALRLVSFDALSDTRIPVPAEYAAFESQQDAPLPPVDNCLHGYAPRRKKKAVFFSSDEADRFGTKAQMFSYFNQVRRTDVKDLPGFLTYLREGTRLMVGDWYAAGNHAGAR